MTRIEPTLRSKYATESRKTCKSKNATAKPSSQPRGVSRRRTMPAILSVTEVYVCPGPRTGGGAKPIGSVTVSDIYPSSSGFGLVMRAR